MTPRVADYQRWVGTWTGEGGTQAGQKTLIRQTFSLALDGTGLEMHFEAFDTSLSVMFHGVRSIRLLEVEDETDLLSRLV